MRFDKLKNVIKKGTDNKKAKDAKDKEYIEEAAKETLEARKMVEDYVSKFEDTEKDEKEAEKKLRLDQIRKGLRYR